MELWWQNSVEKEQNQRFWYVKVANPKGNQP